MRRRPNRNARGDIKTKGQKPLDMLKSHRHILVGSTALRAKMATKTLLEESKIADTVDEIPGVTFTVLDFEPIFKDLYPEDWRHLVERFGEFGEKGDIQYPHICPTDWTCISTSLILC
jgi:hypothetical protein